MSFNETNKQTEFFHLINYWSSHSDLYWFSSTEPFPGETVGWLNTHWQGGRRYTPRSREGGRNPNTCAPHPPMYNYLGLTVTSRRCSSVRSQQSFHFLGYPLYFFPCPTVSTYFGQSKLKFTFWMLLEMHWIVSQLNCHTLPLPWEEGCHFDVFLSSPRSIRQGWAVGAGGFFPYRYLCSIWSIQGNTESCIL